MIPVIVGMNIFNSSLYGSDFIDDDIKLKIDKLKEKEKALENINLNEFIVMVYGKYNHGKSSLLNALIDKKEFKVADKRETTQIKRVFKDGVVWIDTPGIDVDVSGEDDRKAHKALEESDLVLFVHKAEVGELDEKELKELERLNSLNKRVFFILNGIEEVEDLKPIVHNIKSQISFEIDFFEVSAKIYFHNKSKVREYSNIDKLKKRILGVKDELLKEKREYVSRIKEDIANQKLKIVEEIKELKNEVERKIEEKKKNFQSDMREIKRLEDNYNYWENEYFNV